MQLPIAPDNFHLLAKPVGPICNLDCTYCYYLEKENLHPRGEKWAMSREMLERFVRAYIETHRAPEVSFAWQGGEPTLLGLDFYRDAVRFQKQYAGHKRVSNVLQTNGTLLDDEWGRFLKEHDFLVGISIDGPRELHDAYRVDKKKGPTFDAVTRGLDVLKRYGVEFCTLTVLNRLNAKRPTEVYRFLKECGSRFIQFIPLVERHPAPRTVQLGLSFAEPPVAGRPVDCDTPVTEWSVLPEDFGEFLVTVFDEWVSNDVGRISVQLFEVAIGRELGHGPGLCLFAETCGGALVVEHNGDVYSCDHFVYPEYRLGNLADRPLAQLIASDQQRRFGTDKRDTLPAYCLSCEVRHACHGDCPKHRFARTPNGEAGLSYLCPGYKRFFKHIEPRVKTIASLIRSRRPASLVMTMP